MSTREAHYIQIRRTLKTLNVYMGSTSYSDTVHIRKRWVLTWEAHYIQIRCTLEKVEYLHGKHIIFRHNAHSKIFTLEKYVSRLYAYSERKLPMLDTDFVQLAFKLKHGSRGPSIAFLCKAPAILALYSTSFCGGR